MGADVRDQDKRPSERYMGLETDVKSPSMSVALKEDVESAAPLIHPTASTHRGHEAKRKDTLAAATPTTLRPDPPPSAKRRESLAPVFTPDSSDSILNKKRKRGASPPWQFPTAVNSTLKTADGRRVSARHATNSTPLNAAGASGLSSSSELTPLASDTDSVLGNGIGHRERRSRNDSVSVNGKSKPPSPPWKRAQADGPTTIIDNGVRKSGRQHAPRKEEPTRVSPRSKHKVTKSNLDGAANPVPTTATKKPTPREGARERKASVKSEPAEDGVTQTERIQQLRAQINALQPVRSFGDHEKDLTPLNTPTSDGKRNHKRKASMAHAPAVARRSRHSRTETLPPAEKLHDKVAVQSSSAQTGPKIRLKFKASEPVPPPHPLALPPSPARPPRPSLWQLLDDHELRELQQPYSENERGPPGRDHFMARSEKQALDEGQLRSRLLRAGSYGGALTKEGGCSMFFDTNNVPEPRRQYGRVDHLAGHATHFRTLLRREKENHKQLARRLAQEAVERWKQLRGPTEEDLEKERDRVIKAIYVQTVADIRARWELVQRHVEERRKEAWEREEESRRQERLRKQLEWSEAQVRRQRGEIPSDGETSEVDMSDLDSLDEDMLIADGRQLGNQDDSNSEVMSESGSDTTGFESEDEAAEMDGDALKRYIKMRHAGSLDETGNSTEANSVVDEADSGDRDGMDASNIDDTSIPVPDEYADSSATDRPSGALHSPQSAPIDPPAHDLREQPSLSDDQSTDMDSTDYDSDRNMHSSDSSGPGEASPSRTSEDDERPRPEKECGLLGFFSAEQQVAFGVEGDEELDGLVDENNPTTQRTHPPRAAAQSLSTSALGNILEEHNQELEDAARLSEDESTDMDSHDFDSDEDMSSSDDIDEVGASKPVTPAAGSDTEPEDVRASGMFGFFSKAEQAALGLPTSMDVSGSEDEEDDLVLEEEEAVGEVLKEQTNAHLEGHIAGDEVTKSPSRLNDRAEQDVEHGQAKTPTTSSTPDEQINRNLVPVPQLLRATLRPYQHTGLDWLASLFRNGTNGILADEMGLGKTIQTIALLGHVAETYSLWSPHLIIVPTSVILNWVTEFQKFLPGFRVLGYFGTAEERQRLRKGWVNDAHNPDREKRGYNAIITSYQIALKDINALRNVHWSYLVLDEAHNIRNFQSQRFQILIRLRTRARLMLTGTPLQNSLTELWALLTFLTAGGEAQALAEDEDQSSVKHGTLEEFLSHWKEPVREIFDRGVDKLSAEAQAVVSKLHISLRPFLLRRLKSEVEKDLPKKTEEVVVCRLSKRQRQLYQEYMGLADVKRALKSGGEGGSGVTAGRVLMQLRRVCNHPDLFDPRPIQTSFALEDSIVDYWTPKEVIVRQLLQAEGANYRSVSDADGHAQIAVPGFLLLTGREHRRRQIVTRQHKLAIGATSALQREAQHLATQVTSLDACDPSTLSSCRRVQKLHYKNKELVHLRHCVELTSKTTGQMPLYGADLRLRLTTAFSEHDEQCRLMLGRPKMILQPQAERHKSDGLLMRTALLQRELLTVADRASQLKDIITRFTFVTPAATAPVLDQLIPRHTQSLLRAESGITSPTRDAAHESRVRNTIAFPDKRLLIFDSGKLQRLTFLLRELQTRNSRSLIFTQMTATLDILEQFLSLQSIPYLRLDGSTSIGRRQLISSEFNRIDSKYQCMILSSRAGGVGLNLVGASSVIFYDLDWNPQMDRQCMDRAHRIGQVRDVSVYKMVSERTVEENILRRAGQKALLDQTVIQEGRFTTEYPISRDSGGADEIPGSQDAEGVNDALDALLSKGDRDLTTTMESVEDREDVQAAQQARKEEQSTDEADFTDKSSRGASVAPTLGAVTNDYDDADGTGLEGHVDTYMLRWMEKMMEGVAFLPPPKPAGARKDKHGRDPSHRPKKKR